MTAGPLAISLIIPVYNEEATIECLLNQTAGLCLAEVIVVDGGSGDSTVVRAGPQARVLETGLGRGVQMNAGARAAAGDVLWFVHADVELSPRSVDAIRTALADPQVVGGAFDIRYEGDDFAARAFTTINRWRYRFGVFYGDSGIFCRREIFEALGGFVEWPILEDYEFARRLWKRGRVVFLDESIRPAARRWRKGGLWVTLWAWFWIQGLYLVGVSPHWLARMYRHVR